MEYVKLGRTGPDVSRIKKALEAGINFFDTANRYSLGNSEELIVG